MRSFLDVTADDLGRVGPKGAVELFRSLLWADATVYNTRIDVPGAVDAPDGGVDGTVVVPGGAPPPDGTSALRPGLASYQIKTGRSVRIGSKRDRHLLLYGSEKSTELSPRVRECLEAGGTLVFVLFGSDTPARADAESLLRQDLPEGLDYAGARIEVWLQNQLIGHLDRHPALRRRLKDAGHAAYQDRTRWGASEDMKAGFVEGPGHAEFFSKARARLRSRELDVRITGPPGSGKTRAAYEITGKDDLAPLVLYFENPAPLRDGGMLDLLVESRQAHAILVVDECDEKEWERLRNRTGPTGGRIRLVTVHNEKDADDAMEVPELGRETIRKIIKGYNADMDGALLDDLAGWCTPSPRYAHRIGERAASGPGDFLENPLDEKRLHRHYIAGSLPLEGADYRRREAVLLWFGLFTKVGHDRPYSAESGFLAAKMGAHMGMPIGEFDSIVDDLRRLKILQGYRTLYVAPGMLHWWLWREWWERNGRRFPGIGRFLSADGSGEGDQMPESLFGRFADMFANAGASAEAAHAAADMLSEQGLFGDGALLGDRNGARLFLSLARAVPGDALRLLVRTVGAWDDGRLAGFRTGRREAVLALEEIARRTARLGDAAGVLLRLAANENESCSNNAAGVFAALFSPVQGALASTAVGMDERLALLEETLGDPGVRVRSLALEACDRALESVHHTRIDLERGRILSSADGWAPGRKEIASYKKVLDMMLGRMAGMGEAERKKAAGVVLKRAVQLSRLGGMPGPVADAVRFLRDNRMAGEKELLATVVTITSVDLDGMTERDAALWRTLEADMSGSDYRSRMRRYVGMKLAFDYGHAKGGPGGASRADKQVRLLAAETLLDPNAFEKEAAWVLGPDAENSLAFAVELGRRDGLHSMLPRLLGAASAVGGRHPAVALGGYLSHVFERDRGAWESALDAMAGDPRLAPAVPEATWRSGLTDRAWDRIAALYRKGAVEKSSIAVFANTGRACMLSDRAFGEAVKIMLGQASAEDAGRALALLAGRCRCESPRRGIPLDAARRLVTDARILSGGGTGGGATASDLGLDAAAMRIAGDGPEGVPELAGAGGGAAMLDLDLDAAAMRIAGDGPDGIPELAGAGGGAAASEYDWGTVAMRIVEDDPEVIPELAGACLDAMGSGAGVLGGQGGEALRVLDKMASIMPGSVWEEAAGRVAVPPDPRSRHILQWAGGLLLRPGGGGPALLDTAPLEAVWEWIDADKKARSECIARHVPRAIARGRRCIARDVLARYGGDKAVRDAMVSHFLSGNSFGSRGDHFSEMKRRYEGIAEEEDDPSVSMWLGELIDKLGVQAERGRAGDERDE